MLDTGFEKAGYFCGGTLLTDAAAQSGKAKQKAYKLNDSGGLVLYVTASGSELWRMHYTFQGKEKLLSFGPYAEVG